MDYDFRNNNRTNPPPYKSQSQMYNRPPPPSTTTSSSSSTHPMYGPPPPSSSLYPNLGQPSAHPVNAPPAGRPPPFHPAPSPPASSGIGIRVRLNPEFRITPPPQLSPIVDVPRSTFQFDFDLERKILAEAEKENPNWNKLLENLPSRPVESTPSVGPTTDPVVSKYLASGLSREAVPLAVAHYGDNPTKVREFGTAYTHLREMGFRSNNVAEALLMYDNDTDKALAYLLNN